MADEQVATGIFCAGYYTDESSALITYPGLGCATAAAGAQIPTRTPCCNVQLSLPVYPL